MVGGDCNACIQVPPFHFPRDGLVTRWWEAICFLPIYIGTGSIERLLLSPTP